MSNFPLRLPESLMSDARDLAAAQGISINQFLSTVIAERIGELKAMRALNARAARAKPSKALAVLRRAPRRRPVPGDEMPR